MKVANAVALGLGTAYVGAMATARDVATYILEKHGSMTAMKLQKLVYYCQAWALVRLDRPLFEDEIQAWAAGPVVKSLFALHKGKYAIVARDIGGDITALDDAAKQTIDKVVAHYAKLSASQLSNLTHREAPWVEARKGLGPSERGDAVIAPEAMFDFYLSKTKKSGA